MSTETASAGASFYALGPEFEWLAAAWDGFAHELADVSSTLRHVVQAATADPQLVAESSGLAALESATDRLVRELVEDAVRIRHTQTTYEQADAAVHAAVPTVHSPAQAPTGHVSPDAGIPVFGAGIATAASGDRRVGERGSIPGRRRWWAAARLVPRGRLPLALPCRTVQASGTRPDPGPLRDRPRHPQPRPPADPRRGPTTGSRNTFPITKAHGMRGTAPTAPASPPCAGACATPWSRRPCRRSPTASPRKTCAPGTSC